MNKELNNTIPVGTELIFTGNSSIFFTKGNKYKIRTCTIEYTLDDDAEDGNHYWNDNILDSFELPVEETKPVYTQERYDIPTPPCVGDEFLVGNIRDKDSGIEDFRNKKVIVLALTDYKNRTLITFAHKTCGIGCGMFNVEWVKPIDTKTDKEKTQDALDVFCKNELVWTHTTLLEAITLGHIPFLQYTGSK